MWPIDGTLTNLFDPYMWSYQIYFTHIYDPNRSIQPKDGALKDLFNP